MRLILVLVSICWASTSFAGFVDDIKPPKSVVVHSTGHTLIGIK